MKIFAALFLCCSMSYAGEMINTDKTFSIGYLPQGFTIAFVVDGIEIPTNLHIKSTHSDCSVKRGVISAPYPKLSNGSHKISLRRVQMVSSFVNKNNSKCFF